MKKQYVKSISDMVTVSDLDLKKLLDTSDLQRQFKNCTGCKFNRQINKIDARSRCDMVHLILNIGHDELELFVSDVLPSRQVCGYYEE